MKRRVDEIQGEKSIEYIKSNSTSKMNIQRLDNVRPHNLETRHSWIMLLPSRHRRSSRTARSHRGVVSSFVKFAAKRRAMEKDDEPGDGKTPFQDFTGYKFFSTPTKTATSNDSGLIDSSENIYTVQATETEEENAIDYSFWNVQDPELQVVPSRDSGLLERNRIPQEILLPMDDGSIPTVIHVPIPLVREDSSLLGERIIDFSDDDDESNMEDDASEISLDIDIIRHAGCKECFAHQADSLQFLYPLHYSHHSIQHDATWGITTATLEDPLEKLATDGKPNVNAIESPQNDYWPSDEEKSEKSVDMISLGPKAISLSHSGSNSVIPSHNDVKNPLMTTGSDVQWVRFGI